ncbi:hypothetical protein GA0115260_100205 [Streptomyces sp. MnatMP-M27]|nr:hypothetical protein GA0115260_100205 [Streptomyces sp. MnatMP-M27]
MNKLSIRAGRLFARLDEAVTTRNAQLARELLARANASAAHDRTEDEDRIAGAAADFAVAQTRGGRARASCSIAKTTSVCVSPAIVAPTAKLLSRDMPGVPLTSSTYGLPSSVRIKSMITITADTYTTLPPEADLAIAEAAARLVPRVRAASEDTVSGVEPESDGTERSGPEVVPDDADPLGVIREINSPCAQASLTRTASDEESEAE